MLLWYWWLLMDTVVKSVSVCVVYTQGPELRDVIDERSRV